MANEDPIWMDSQYITPHLDVRVKNENRFQIPKFSFVKVEINETLDIWPQFSVFPKW